MDFFTMKRKKLQNYCKKHGIPANLKNVEMARQLSLIYQGEKNTNHVSCMLQSDKIKKPIEIIILDSDSDTDVEMEVSGVSAELDGVKSDQKFDNDQIEDNQGLSPSDLNVEADEGADKDKLNVEVIDLDSDSGDDDVQMEALDTVAGNDSNEKTNLSDDHKLEEEPEQLSQVKSDHKVDSDTVAEKDSDEKTSVSAELDGVKSDHKVDNDQIEDNQDLSPATPSESGNVLEQFGNYTMMGGFDMSSEYTDVHQGSMIENVNLFYVSPMKYSDYSVDHVHKSDDNIGHYDLEENFQIHTNEENIDPSEEGLNAEPIAVGMSDNEDLTQSVSEELGNDLIEGQVANMDNLIDLQDVCGSGNGSDEAVNKCGINCPHVSPKESSACLIEQLHKPDDNNCVLSEAETGNGSNEAVNQGCIDSRHGLNVNNADRLHVSLVESSSPLVGGQVQKYDDNAMHSGDYDLGNCGFGIDILCSHDISIAAEDIDAKTNVSMENLPYESHAPSVKLSDDDDLVLAASSGTKKVLSETTMVHKDSSGTRKAEDEAEKIDQINSQGSVMENINSLNVSRKESNGRSIEQIQNLEDNTCVMDESATMCLDASTGVENTDENTDVAVIVAVHSSNFVDSSVQFPPIDQFREVETNDLVLHKMVAIDTSRVKVLSEELTNNSMEEEVEDVDDKFDLPEDVYETVNGCKEAINQGSIDDTHGSNVNNVDLLHVSSVELSSPLVGGQVQESVNNVMPGGNYDLRGCGFAVDVFCSHDKSIAAEDTDDKTIMSMENHPYEGHSLLPISMCKEDFMNPTWSPTSEVMNRCEDLYRIGQSSPLSHWFCGGVRFNPYHSPSGKYSDVEDLQLSASAEFGKKLVEVEFDLLEDDCESAKCKDGALNSSSIKSPKESTVNDFNLLHDSLGDFSSYFDDEVQKPDDKIMHVESGKSESGIDAFCFPDESIVAKNTDGKNESMQKSSYEGSADGNADALEVKSESKLKSPPDGEDIGSVNMEERMEMNVDKEKIEENQELDPATQSEDDNMEKGEVEVLTEKTKVHEDSSGTKKVEDEAEKIDQINIHQGSFMENVNSSNNNCVLSEAATVCLDASTGAKNTDENTNFTAVDILDAFYLSSFEDSSVQFPPIDPLRKVETSDLALHKMVATDTSRVKVLSEELTNNSMEEEVEDVDDKFDLPEDVSETVNGCKEAINQGSIDNTHGLNVNNVDLLHVFPVELSSPLVGGQVQKSDHNVMPGGDYDLRSCGFAVDVFCSHDKSIAAEDTEDKTIVSIENHPYEGHAPSVKLSDDDNLVLAASEEFGKKLAEVEFDLLEDKKCKDEALNSSSIKSPQGSIVNDLNLLHDSLGEFSSYFDGEIQKPDDKIMHCGSRESESGVDAFCFLDESIVAKNTDGKNNESMQKNSYEGTCEAMLKSSETSCIPADPENCGDGGVGAEDENQPSETVSRKTKKSDANSDEEVIDALVPTVLQTSEMDSSNFNLHQLFASETASGDEDAYPKKLDSPSKATPMIHKENIKFDKKEEVGSLMSRNKFAKRQPLQDLKQN